MISYMLSPDLSVMCILTAHHFKIMQRSACLKAKRSHYVRVMAADHDSDFAQDGSLLLLCMALPELLHSAIMHLAHFGLVHLHTKHISGIFKTYRTWGASIPCSTQKHFECRRIRSQLCIKSG